MNQWKIFVKTMNVMGKCRSRYFTGIFFMSVGWALFAIMTSLLMKNVVDAAESGNAKQIPIIIVGNVIGGFVALIIYRAAAIVYNVEAKRAYGILCKMVFSQGVRMPYEYYENHHSGEFISKISYDLEKTGSIYGSRLRRTVAPILQVVVYLVMMFVLSWQITFCLIAVNLCMLMLNGLLIEPIRNVSKELSKTNSKMTEKMSNLLQGIKSARMYSAGWKTVQAFVDENEKFANQSKKKVLFVSMLECSSSGFELLCALVFLMLGIYFVNGGYTTLGSLTAIYSLYGTFSFQFLQLGKYLPELIGCLVNAQNIFAFMNEEIEPKCWYSEVNENDKSLESETMVFMEKVNFYYRKDKLLLKNFSMNVKKGESVVITGSSGCGKTTLTKILLGLYPVVSGDIGVDGQSYRQLENIEVRRKIAYVPQEPYLFNETIRENIRIGKLNATDEEIEMAAKMAYAHDFIIELENGYDTKVGERGNNLSGGQRQRIAIARAIIKDSPIVLLDEATSALDNESEQLVNEALKSMKDKKTIIMIAHRPSTIALADKEVAI